jgi:glycosyltransferase involved in cell wall biosynthesis
VVENISYREAEGLRIMIITPFNFIAKEIATRLAKKGAHVLIITTGSLDKDIRSNKIKVFSLSSMKSDLFRIMKMFMEIMSFRPVIIQLYSGGGLLGLLTFPITKICSTLLGSKIVSWIMEPVPRLGIDKYHLAWIVTKLETKSSSLIITDAEKLKRIIAKVHGVPYEKIVVLKNEWDAPVFYRWKREGVSEKKWVLFFGNVTEHRGLEYLIKAEPIITSTHPDVKIVIAGKSQEKYYNLIRNKENFILINKFISYEEGAKIFQESMIIVLPYITGTISGIIPVAYAFKKPVVASKVGCFYEVIEDKRTGILVPPRDPKALAEAIVYLLENEDLRRKMGEQGFIKLKKEMAWDIVSNKLLQIYIKLLVNDR